MNEMKEYTEKMFEDIKHIDEDGKEYWSARELQKLWIYEVNWRPGCPPAFYLELDVVKNTIQYAVYLANHQQEIKEKIQLAKSEIHQEEKQVIPQKREIPIISITGSAGKTTTKAFLASILSTRWNVFQSKDYWNTTEHTKKHKELITAEHEADAAGIEQADRSFEETTGQTGQTTVTKNTCRPARLYE